MILALALTLLASAANAQGTESADSWFELDVPGSSASFARLAGISEAVEPRFLLIEWSRVHHLPSVDGGFRVDRLREYIQTLLRFADLVSAASQEACAAQRICTPATVSLTSLASSGEASRFLLELIGLRAQRLGPSVRLVAVDAKEASLVRDYIEAAGLSLRGIESRLNDGDAVSLTIPSFKAVLPMSATWWRALLADQPDGPLLANFIWRPQVVGMSLALAVTHRGTRRHLAASQSLASRLYRDFASVFSRTASALDVRDGRVVVPGGREAEESWSRLLGARPDQPDEFIRRLLATDGGRAAHVYGVLQGLSPAHAAFALGLHSSARRRGVEPLYTAWVGALENETSLDDSYPARLALMLSQLRVHASGELATREARSLWVRVFASSSIPGPTVPIQQGADIVDVTDLVDILLREREGWQQRLAVFLFAQRMALSGESTSDESRVVALRGAWRFPLLHFTLEQMGLVGAAVHELAARRADALMRTRDADSAFESLSSLQGCIALLERARRSDSLSRPEAEALVTSLMRLEPRRGGRYGSRAAAWLRTSLLPALGVPGADRESDEREGSLIQALAGQKSGGAGPSVSTIFEFEGWRYRVDPVLALSRRVARARERQRTVSLDDVLTLLDVVERLRSAATVREVDEQRLRLGRLRERIRQPPVAGSSTDNRILPSQAFEEALRELARVRRDRQIRNVLGTIDFWLEPLVGLVTADFLRGFVYALGSGDPESPLLERPEVWSQHDLGVSAAGSVRQRTPWQLPELQFGSQPRIKGSLLGLSLPMAETALRAGAVLDMPRPSIWSSADRRTVPFVLALFDPFAIPTGSAARVSSALKEGRAAVRALDGSALQFERLAERAQLSPMRRSMAWLELLRGSTTVDALFSPEELLRLAEDATVLEMAAAFGSPATPFSGCLCLSVPPSLNWEFLPRSDELGLLAGAVSGVGLRLAELSNEIGVPEAVLGDVLPAVVNDLLNAGALSYRQDRDGVVRYFAKLTRTRFEDYLARTVRGGAMVPLQMD